MMENNLPIEGCAGCSTTGGKASCLIHGRNINFTSENVRPFVFLILRCPHCGGDIELQGFALSREKLVRVF